MSGKNTRDTFEAISLYLGDYMNDFAVKVLTAPSGKTHLFSVGQAGFIIKSKSGQLLAIDLYLSDCVERIEGHDGFKRLLPKILSPYDLELDVIIATHFHRDHFDIDIIPSLMSNGNTKLFAAEDCRDSVRQMEMTENNITYVKPNETHICGDFEIDFVSCDHGTGAPEAVGVMVKVDGKLLFETGDTCLRSDWVNDFKKHGRTDVLIAPINGAFGNMNEQDCADFANAIDAQLTIPCHYGMFASHGGNVGKFYNIMKEQYPVRRFCVMAQGEKLTI